MKKSILFAAIVALSMTANAQWFDFSQNSNRIGIGLNMGELGRGTSYTDFGGGVSINILGVYIDYTQAGPDHKYDNHVTNTLYNDSVAFTLNVGYQIPVLPWLRVMPLVGYCQTNAGLTDATTVNVEVNGEYDASVYHDYTVTSGTRQHYFNAGVGLVITPIRWIDLFAIGTMHSITGGISFNLSEFRDN